MLTRKMQERALFSHVQDDCSKVIRQMEICMIEAQERLKNHTFEYDYEEENEASSRKIGDYIINLINDEISDLLPEPEGYYSDEFLKYSTAYVANEFINHSDSYKYMIRHIVASIGKEICKEMCEKIKKEYNEEE